MFGKPNPNPDAGDQAAPMLPWPYGSDLVVQDPGAVVADDSPHGFALLAAEHLADGKIARELPHAPQSTPEATAWYQGQHDAGSTAWLRLCLMGARVARGVPAVHPNARSAGEATPHDHRVTDPKDIQPGMVLYFWGDDAGDDPNGHICTAAFDPGDHAGLEIPTWTNDAKVSGGMDRVPGAWFPLHWGKPFRFAATSLNGFELDGAWNQLDRPRPTDGRPVDLIRDLREAHTAVLAAEKRARQSDHDALAHLLDQSAHLIARRVARLLGAN